jgi:hypothetical protein
MTTLRFLLSTILFLLSGLASASTYTIDFESAPTGSSVSFNTQGFTFQQNTAGIGIVDAVNGFPSGNSFFFCMDCENPTGFSMERTDGSLFSLLAFDFGFYQQDPMPLAVTGTFADNSQVSTSFNNVTGLFDTLALGSGWDNLASVSFAVDTTNNYPFNVPAFDNIVVSAVPVPAAAWLFGSALAGLGWFRRKA